jgi:hypothetical protein
MIAKVLLSQIIEPIMKPDPLGSSVDIKNDKTALPYTAGNDAEGKIENR